MNERKPTNKVSAQSPANRQFERKPSFKIEEKKEERSPSVRKEASVKIESEVLNHSSDHSDHKPAEITFKPSVEAENQHRA